jgi:hypothetical protein
MTTTGDSHGGLAEDRRSLGFGLQGSGNPQCADQTQVRQNDERQDDKQYRHCCRGDESTLSANSGADCVADQLHHLLPPPGDQLALERHAWP